MVDPSSYVRRCYTVSTENNAPLKDATKKPTVPLACRELWLNLQRCEAQVSPDESSCFLQRGVFRVCLRATRFGSTH